MRADLVDSDLIERVLRTALRRGGDFAEIFVEDRGSRAAVLDQRRVETLGSGHERGAGIRVIAGATTGFAHTADLSEAGLLSAAEAAATAVGERDGRVHEIALGATQRHRTEVGESPVSVDKERVIEQLRRADDVARGAAGSIAQVQVSVGGSTRRLLIANSNGLVVTDEQVRTRFAVACVAEGDGGMQTGYRPFGATGGYELLTDDLIDEAARAAARQAVTKLGARPAPSGDLPVVLAGGTGGILFHEACGHGLEADAVAKEASVYAGRRGERVASSLVTLVDDGTVAGEWGHVAVDDEGHAGTRTVLIENGVLVDYMWDYLRARSAGRGHSGNGRRQGYQYLPMVRMTNTFLLAGDSDAEEIVAQTPYGIYVAQLGGGQVNTTTGDFVFGATSALLIEGGRITTPLRDCNLIGNGPTILQRVDAVAGDFSMGGPGTCGKNGQQVPVGTGQPTLRLSAVTVGGTAT